MPLPAQPQRAQVDAEVAGLVGHLRQVAPAQQFVEMLAGLADALADPADVGQRQRRVQALVRAGATPIARQAV